MKRSAAFVAVSCIGLLAACGSTTHSLQPSDIANQLPGMMHQDAYYKGVTITVSKCDAAIKNIGDISLCTVTLDNGAERVHMVISVTKEDSIGHLRWATDHVVN